MKFKIDLVGIQKVIAAYNKEKGITDNVDCNGLLIVAPELMISSGLIMMK